MTPRVKPFLKWAGGKRWLVQSCPWILEERFDRLVEPFVGSAAFFFSARPKRAWLNDINAELIAAYAQIRRDWRSVFRLLKTYQAKHSPTFYYAMRDATPKDSVASAARFVYLNRTCFNGIYRVNLKGVFNVPIGDKKSVIFPDDDFEAVSKTLKCAKLTAVDFQKVIDACGRGDLLFVDPPYTVKHNFNGFLKYNEQLFTWADQIRLRDSVFRAKGRGAKVLVSNADHPSIHTLYRGAQEVMSVDRHSVIAADAAKRKSTSELLIFA